MLKSAPLALFFLLPCFAVLAGGPPEIPFRFDDGFIRVAVQTEVSRTPLSMLLDSGASVSVLNVETARRLDVRTGESLSIRGVASDADAYEIEPLRATMSGIECGHVVLAADMSRANQLCAEPIDGLIGVDFFRDRVVQIDYSQRRLRLLPRAPKRTSAALRLPLKLINGVPCVGVGVNGSSARWTRLDTGCNDALHWVIPKSARERKPHSASVGFVTDTRDVALARIALGKRELHSIPTSLHGRPFFEGEAGLLGNGVLSRFAATVDWPGMSLILEERRD
jgi:hypothetical protein